MKMKRGVTVSFSPSTIKTFLPDMFMTQITQILLASRVLGTPGSGGYLPWPENKVMILQLM